MTPQELKNSILQLAVQGKLVEQRPEEGTGEELYQQIQAEKQKLIKTDKINKGKPLPEISEDEIPFEIPESWTWLRLRTVVYNRGQIVPETTFSYIDIGSIDNKNQRLNAEENFIEADKAPSRARKIVERGDILYSTVRPYLHNMCIIDRDFTYIDVACFPGSSGSPVFLRKNGLEKETKADGSLTLAIKPRYAFLGTLLNNFIYLFRYVDRSFRCTFVSIQAELGTIERLAGVKGKKDYVSGIAFSAKRILSLLQMAAYNQELKRYDIRLEDIFKWFFEEYLKNEFGVNGFTYTPPSEGTTLAEKCKLLSIAIDGVLKQYRLYCEDGVVDRELLEMSSGHVVFSDLSGMLNNKYAYAASDNLRAEMYLLFSDQSMMNFTEKTGSTYRTLPQLLLSEQMNRDDFAEYQYRNLDWLIERSSVRQSEDGTLSLNKNRAYILKDLFINEVICPRYYDHKLQEQVA